MTSSPTSCKFDGIPTYHAGFPGIGRTRDGLSTWAWCWGASRNSNLIFSLSTPIYTALVVSGELCNICSRRSHECAQTRPRGGQTWLALLALQPSIVLAIVCGRLPRKWKPPRTRGQFGYRMGLSPVCEPEGTLCNYSCLRSRWAAYKMEVWNRG